MITLFENLQHMIVQVRMYFSQYSTGSRLWDVLSSLDKRIVVIISADLAHTHDKDGPCGFSTAAEPFDKVCDILASLRKHTYAPG